MSSLAFKKTGPTSYGYERRNGKLVAHPHEAPIRRRMFELFAKHQRKKTVAEILNAEGAMTRNGAQFTGQTIGRLLEDESVIGVPGETQAIVPKDLFDRCKTILESQRASGGAKRKAVHLFSGLVFCGCGGKMYVPSNTRKYVCGNCRAKVPVDDLEAVFCAQLPNCKLPRELSEAFSDLAHLWPTLAFEDKREIVECVTHRIELRNHNVSLRFIAL